MGNQDNRDGSDSDNRNTQSHPSGSVSGHNSEQAKILELCKKHIDQYFSSIRIEKSSDTKADIFTSLERIAQLIREDKDSLKDLGITLQYSTLVDPLVQEYLVEKYNDLIQPESLSLLKKLNTESEFNNINFIIDIINSIMEPNHKLFADPIINNNKFRKLINNIQGYVIKTNNSSLLGFIFERNMNGQDRILYVNKPGNDQSNFEGKPVLPTMLWASMNHALEVLRVITNKVCNLVDTIANPVPSPELMYQSQPEINILTMALKCYYPDRDEVDRERLKTGTVSHILNLIFNLRSGPNSGFSLYTYNILSDTIKFLVASNDNDSSVLLPDLPKNAKLLNNSKALDYLINALKNYPKCSASELGKGWIYGIICAIEHEHIELLMALFNLAISDKNNTRCINKKTKFVVETSNPAMISALEEFSSFIEIESLLQEICAICRESTGNLCQLPCKCKCYYHKECIKGWLDINASCPVCRGNDVNLRTITGTRIVSVQFCGRKIC